MDDVVITHILIVGQCVGLGLWLRKMPAVLRIRFIKIKKIVYLILFFISQYVIPVSEINIYC